MQYINKSISKFKDKAYSILRGFIQGQWDKDAGCYVNLSHRSLSKNDLRDLLLKEQEHYCCYCMKHILDRETTLEHVIPQSADTALIDKYAPYGELKNNVFFLDNLKTQLSMPPFPHILSYENMVASCNGHIPEKGNGKHCNNARGSKDIIPLFYIKDIGNEIKYELNGMIDCDQKYHETLKNLELEHPTLQLFRRCWLNLPPKYNALDVIDASNDENLRNQIVDDMELIEISIKDRNTIKNPIYWNTFMNYFWFYFYKTQQL